MGRETDRQTETEREKRKRRERKEGRKEERLTELSLFHQVSGVNSGTSHIPALAHD